MIAKELSNALVQKSAQEIEKKEVHICVLGEVVREACCRRKLGEVARTGIEKSQHMVAQINFNFTVKEYL